MLNARHAIKALGFDHARYNVESLTDDSLRASVYMLANYVTLADDFATYRASYDAGYREWEGKA